MGHRSGQLLRAAYFFRRKRGRRRSRRSAAACMRAEHRRMTTTPWRGCTDGANGRVLVEAEREAARELGKGAEQYDTTYSLHSNTWQLTVPLCCLPLLAHDWRRKRGSEEFPGFPG